MVEFAEQGRELFDALAVFRRKRGKFHVVGDLCMSEMAVFGALMKLSGDLEQDKVEPLRMSEISGEVEISKPALSQIVNKLENKGLVERIFSKEDRRATYLAFTPKGLEIYRREHNEMVTAINNIVAQMGTEDTKEFIALLNRFDDIVSKYLQDKEQGDLNKCQDC